MECLKLAHIESDQSPLRCVWKSTKSPKSDVNCYDYGARFYDPVIGRWHVPDLMYARHYDWSPYAYVLNNPLANIDLYGLTDWSKILKGAATFTAGLGSTVGGVAAAMTPTGVGQVGGAILISTGTASMGLGASMIVDGAKDGTLDIPGGVNEGLGMALDDISGNENEGFRKAGAVADVAANFAGGAPETAIEKVAVAILAVDAANSIISDGDGSSGTDSNADSSLPDTPTTAVDNTQVAPTPELQIESVPEVSLDEIIFEED